MSSAESNTLPTDVFFKDNFGIDDYLSKCTQKSDLLTLRKDLKNYGAELYSNMVEILKMETEEIVNLAENLTNLSSKIDELSTPVSQLCEEIRMLHHTIKESKIYFEKHLKTIQSVRSEIDNLTLKMEIMSLCEYLSNIIASWSDDDIIVLERAVNEYSFQYLYLNKVGIDVTDIDDIVMNTASRLLELVHSTFLKSIRTNDDEIILRCLRMYINLDKQEAAEKCFRDKIVEPKLQSLFTSRNLDEHNQDVKVLYDQALDFLHVEMKTLLVVVNSNVDVKDFNFVTNSFWIEADKQLRENLPNITAPGNPDLFQRRYKYTWQFLQEVVDAAGDPQLFKKDETFQAHLKRFNLPVYFEIRFQQIATKFEVEMFLDPADFTESDLTTTDDLFRLKMSSALWYAIQQCFDEDIFLIPLTDQFLKLKMLLLSRYLNWFESCISKWKSSASTASVDIQKLEKFIIYALLDINIFTELIGFQANDAHGLDDTVFKVIPNEIRPPILQVLHINKELLDDMYHKLQEQLINFNVQQSAIHLQQVTSIPRLYRRTNRSIPKEPSNYVVEAVVPFVKLHSSYNDIIGEKLVPIMDLSIANLSDQYIKLVQEVLRSVCKTEESLRRLKSRNVGNADDSMAQANADATSDETKIREQIKLDIGHFVQKLKPFAVDASKPLLKQLMDESGYQ